MKTKKITRTVEITLEQNEVRLIINRRKIFSDCEKCGEKTKLLPPEEIGNFSPRLIYRLIESQRIYFTELPDGLLLVCAECVKREEEKF